MDLSVEIGSLRLSNPLIAASGCYGYGVEYADAVDLSTLGAVASKGLFLAPREGHPPQRIVETPSGMLNAIGLQGIGVHRYIAEKLPELRRLGATNIINICGSTLDEYVELARILSDADGVHALELNISCPNIKEGGITFGCSLHGTFDVVSAVKKVTRLPVIPKLTPNVTDVASIAKAAQQTGQTVGVKDKGIIVVGSNCSPRSIAAIKDGLMYADLQQSPVYISKKASEVVIEALEGKSVELEYVMPTPTIEASNVQKYAKACNF